MATPRSAADAAISRVAGGDEVFGVDARADQVLLASLIERAAGRWPGRLIMEGLDDPATIGDPGGPWVYLADPMDGTRPWLAGKRSAWVLLGAGRRAETLEDLEVGAAVELPTERARWTRAAWAAGATWPGPATPTPPWPPNCDPGGRFPSTLAEPRRRRLQQETADRQAAVEHLAQHLLAGEDPGQRHLLASHHGQPPLRRVGRGGEGVDGRCLEGQLDAADARQVDGQTEQVGSVREWRQGPREGQREMEVVGRVLLLGEVHHRVLEGEQHAGIDLERQVKVERAGAALFRMQVDLPGLAQRVGLDEMALVVNVKAVIDGVLLDLGHVPGHVDDGHGRQRTGG
jgi:hypothetical protein